ncbi:MAG: hypothetical protein KGL39_22910 [Patescibacteria group bacterium]|nr:hypothetical protein [Patescibacteria group bacterium]
MKKFSGLLVTVAAALVLFGLGTGCQTHLAPGGAYAPGYFTVQTNADGSTGTKFTATAQADIAFYYADASYNTAFAIVDGAFKWEQQNRAALWKLNPNIKHTLDKLRPTAWDIHVRWAKARQAYLQNPIAANLTSYELIVAEIQKVAATAQATETTAITPTK